MEIERIFTLIVPIMIVVAIALVFIVPIVIDMYQINKNEKQYGEKLNNWDLQRKWDCINFCGGKNIRFIPSTLFKQEVCECK